MTDAPWPQDSPRLEIRPVLHDDYAYADYSDYEFDCHNLDKQEVKTRFDRWAKNARILVDERGPGFIDAAGTWRPFPPETRRLVARHFTTVFRGFDAIPPEYRWLLFCDETYRVLLMVDSYGWRQPDLVNVAAASGWHFDTKQAIVSLQKPEEDPLPIRVTLREPHLMVGGYWEHTPLKERLHHLFHHGAEPAAPGPQPTKPGQAP